MDYQKELNEVNIQLARQTKLVQALRKENENIYAANEEMAKEMREVQKVNDQLTYFFADIEQRLAQVEEDARRVIPKLVDLRPPGQLVEPVKGDPFGGIKPQGVWYDDMPQVPPVARPPRPAARPLPGAPAPRMAMNDEEYRMLLDDWERRYDARFQEAARYFREMIPGNAVEQGAALNTWSNNYKNLNPKPIRLADQPLGGRAGRGDNIQDIMARAEAQLQRLNNLPAFPAPEPQEPAPDPFDEVDVDENDW